MTDEEKEENRKQYELCYKDPQKSHGLLTCYGYFCGEPEDD